MILIDYRMGSVDLIPYMPPELTKKTTLESGDVAFFGHGPGGQFTYPIGIEYKTIKEVLQKMVNKGFVGGQFPKMTNLYSRIYFIVEGECEEGPDGTLLVPAWQNKKRVWKSFGWKTTYRQFDNWQNSLTETGKVNFKRARDRKEAAAQVLDLYYMWTKDYSQHQSLFAFDKSQLPPSSEQPSLLRLMAAQVPMVGWKRSKAVEQAFASPFEAFTAGEEEWLQVKGIGPTIAKRIVQALRTNS